MKIPLNRPGAAKTELRRLARVLAGHKWGSGGPAGERCAERLRRLTGAKAVFLTHTGSQALEMAALLAGFGPGDEAVMPSFTFVSTANAFVLRGARPVYADILPDTLNLDPAAAASSSGRRTRAVVPVHYAGVACQMKALLALARRRRALVIEDAAHGILARCAEGVLGAIGQLGALSFHDTKNVTCGEGGALLINDASLVAPARALADKGTNRHEFLQGKRRHYEWVAPGVSAGPSEFTAAVLDAQLDAAPRFLAERRRLWSAYHRRFQRLEERGRLRRPVVPDAKGFNAHIYYVLVEKAAWRDAFIRHLKSKGVGAASHFVPLHLSKFGRRFLKRGQKLPVTESAAARLVRLPLWPSLRESDVDYVARTAESFFG